MSALKLIIEREYLSRVRKKSFIIMTILGPLLMSALFVVPILISEMDTEEKRIVVMDHTGFFMDAFPPKDGVQLKFVPPVDVLEAKSGYQEHGADGLLFIPKPTESFNYTESAIQFFSDQTLSLNIKRYLENNLERKIERLKYRALGMDPEVVESVKTQISINTLVMSEEGELESSSELNTAVGYISGILIYMFIFVYGAMVMRGVIEEKSNRIVEVIISSVKPFQLMLGKILGVAATGLTQFVLWIVLTFALISVAKATLLPDAYDAASIQQGVEIAAYEGNQDIARFMDLLSAINFPLIIGCFIFYFLGGYLLYSALFAAIGSAVDNEADSQQFMLPVTVPLILSFMVAASVIENPDGPIAFWFSMIPFTSPIVMMVRIPFGVPAWELALSMGLVIGGFLLTTYTASRIYRIGILMYGKKVSWGEIIKWMRYKG